MHSQNKISFLTIFSVLLVLILIGGVILVTLHTKRMNNVIKEKLNIVVELKDSIPSLTPNNIIANLESREEVVEGSVSYIDKESAVDLMGLENQNNTVLLTDNPFQNAIIFNVEHSHYNRFNLNELKSNIEAIPEVSGVYFQDDFLDGITASIRKLSLFVIVFGLLLLVLSIALIYNTIKLSLMSDQEKIKTKMLVGAKWRYIKLPYLRSSFRIGWVSALLATLILGGIIFLLKSKFAFLTGIMSIPYIVFTVILVFVLGISIPMIATNRMVNQYLKNLYTY